MTDWQPIETAPRDGTPFLAFCGGIVQIIQMGDGWGEGVVTKPSGPCWAVSDGEDPIENEGWDTGTGATYSPKGEPTHWVPLPKPPVIQP